MDSGYNKKSFFTGKKSHSLFYPGLFDPLHFSLRHEFQGETKKCNKFIVEVVGGKEI